MRGGFHGGGQEAVPCILVHVCNVDDDPSQHCLS